MRERDSKRASVHLSWLLRHGAREAKLTMDAAGWARISDVLAETKLSMDELEHVVAHNTKLRLEIVGDRIRASQGHSTEGTPVTLEALEASWRVPELPSRVYHGTNLVALNDIHREGLRAGKRTHVHLARAVDSAVGKRANVDVLLGVETERLMLHKVRVFESSNGVLLAREIPRDAIVSFVPLSRDAIQQTGLLSERYQLVAEVI